MSYFVFFPNLETTTFGTLTQETIQDFVDRVLIKSIWDTMPGDILHHLPRSYEDAQLKSYAK